MPIRPISSVFIAWMKPEPSAPTIHSFGISQSSKYSAAVGDPRTPIFSSGSLAVMPGVSLWTSRLLTPP